MVLEDRPYQRECLDIIDNLDHGAYLVVLATGLGKTVIMSRIKRKGRVLILSHREELVHQPEKYYDCPFGVERAEECSNGEEVVSASVQTLIHRLDRFKPDEFDMVITDEAHHAVAPSYMKIYDYFNPRLHIGFTATPNRGDKVGLKAIYEKIIYKKDIKWGIENNYLVDIDCCSVDIGYDLRKVKRSMGDFESHALEEAVDKQKANEGVAAIYEQMAVGPTIIFASSVSHARNIAEFIPGSVIITASTKNRAELLEKFANGKIRCIINCMVLTEGTDLPMIRTIIVARPTMNSSLYIQMVGRGLRKYEGKECLKLIDCVGNTGNIDICTAPTLFGIDPSLVPKENRHKLKGRLTEMPNLMKRLMDSPEGWLLNKENVNLFSKTNKVKMDDINYIIHYDDSISCVLSKGRYLISSPDELGKCNVYWIAKGGFRKDLLQRDIKLQDAAMYVRRRLNTIHGNESHLWDNKKMETWSGKPATTNQKKYIMALMRKPFVQEELGKDGQIDLDGLSRLDASTIIGNLISFKSRKQKP